MTYKPIINYIVAAGIALGATFMPREVNAEESLKKFVCTYDSVQGSLCSCQPAEKTKAKLVPKVVKKNLTIEETCAQQKVDAQGRCAYDRDQNLAKTKEDLWEEATRTGEYDNFGRVVLLEEANAHNKYSLCVLEARVGEYDCIKDAKEEQERQAQDKKEAAAKRIRDYDLCEKSCQNRFFKNYGKIVREENLKARDKGDWLTSAEIYRRADILFEERQGRKDKCIQLCGPNPRPQPKRQRGRYEGTIKIDL